MSGFDWQGSRGRQSREARQAQRDADLEVLARRWAFAQDSDRHSRSEPASGVTVGSQRWRAVHEMSRQLDAERTQFDLHRRMSASVWPFCG